MDDNGEGQGNEFVFPTNLKPPSIGAKYKKANVASEPILVELATTTMGVTDSPKNTQTTSPDIQSPPLDSGSQQASPTRSPRDPTPILINGSEFSRDDFTPIIDQDEMEDMISRDLEVYTRNNSKRFNNSISYQTAVSTDASPSSNQPNPKITSPSSDISIDPRPIRQQQTNNTFLQIERKPSSNPPSPERKITTTSDTQSLPPSTGKTNLQQKKISAPQTNTEFQKKQHLPAAQQPQPQPQNQTQSQAQQAQQQSLPQSQSQQAQQQSPTKQNVSEEKPLTHEELVARAHDYFLKYQILQKSWPEYRFPNLDESLVFSKPQMIIDSYTTSIERIQIDMDVSQYKIALIIMFLVIEVVCVKFLGFDAGGYTLSQIKAMNRYEKLLIEIGERKLLAGGDSWPPEVKILFIGLFNCGLFILMKYLSSILGPQLISYISPIVNGLFSGVLDTSKAATLPDEIPKVPERQQDFSGMLGNVASMAANAFTNNSNPQPQGGRVQTKASRRPVYRE
jgi:hypothetical protein